MEPGRLSSGRREIVSIGIDTDATFGLSLIDVAVVGAVHDQDKARPQRNHIVAESPKRLIRPLAPDSDVHNALAVLPAQDRSEGLAFGDTRTNTLRDRVPQDNDRRPGLTIGLRGGVPVGRMENPRPQVLERD